MSNKTIEFLYKAAEALPSDNRTQLLLKSFYLTRSNAHGAHQFTTGQRTTPDGDAADACRRCATKYQHKQFRLQLRPSRQSSRRARRLVQRNESRHESSSLSAAQRIQAKKYLKTVNTVAKSTCTVCHMQRRTVIRHLNSAVCAKRRTKAVATVVQSDPNVAVDLGTVELVKKKKKSTDKNAGLRIPCKTTPTSSDVMPINTKHTTSIVMKVPAAATPVKIVPKVQQSLSLLSQKQQPINKNLATTTKANKNRNGGSVGKANQKKPAKLSASEKRAADAKQRNSMLLLANVLKMKDSSTAKRPSGLETMLRK